MTCISLSIIVLPGLFQGLKDLADIFSASMKDSGRDTIVQDDIDNLEDKPRGLHRCDSQSWKSFFFSKVHPSFNLVSYVENCFGWQCYY